MTTTPTPKTGEGNAPHVGQQIKLSRDVERFSDFIAPKGATGIVAHVGKGIVTVKMDAPLKGCEHWDNHIIWNDDYDQDFASDIQYI
ncbi:MAG TPA: hypothetical protein VFG51_00090 [Candidatus Saccharimonadia bacterium]|nr:hypothetical protein [Candidatus Saccharimonadia bacterium]